MEELDIWWIQNTNKTAPQQTPPDQNPAGLRPPRLHLQVPGSIMLVEKYKKKIAGSADFLLKIKTGLKSKFLSVRFDQLWHAFGSTCYFTFVRFIGYGVDA